MRTVLNLDLYPQQNALERCSRLIDAAADLGADAIALSDPGLMQYALRTYPSLPLHLTARAGATNHVAIAFHSEHFGIERATLPATLTLDRIEQIARKTSVGLEVHAYGDSCVMVEGRCSLSSYVTSSSRNTTGVCTPLAAVQWQHTHGGIECRLNDVLVNRYNEHEKARHPTPCSGRYDVGGRTCPAFEDVARINALERLPVLCQLGIAAVRIEAKRREVPHLSQVTRVWRNAIDMCWRDPTRFGWASELATVLRRLSEGQLQSPSVAYTRGK